MDQESERQYTQAKPCFELASLASFTCTVITDWQIVNSHLLFIQAGCSNVRMQQSNSLGNAAKIISIFIMSTNSLVPLTGERMNCVTVTNAEFYILYIVYINIFLHSCT